MQKRTCMRRRNSRTLYRSVFCISWLLSSIRQELQSAKNFTKVIRSRGSLCVCVCIKERLRTFEANNSYSWNTSKASFFPYSFSASDNIYQSHSKRRLCSWTTWLETSHLGLLGGWSCTTNVFLSFFLYACRPCVSVSQCGLFSAKKVFSLLHCGRSIMTAALNCWWVCLNWRKQAKRTTKARKESPKQINLGKVFCWLKFGLLKMWLKFVSNGCWRLASRYFRIIFATQIWHTLS